MKPELHWFPGTCSRVTLVALEEIGVPFELRLVNRLAGERVESALNPKGRVPTLVVGGGSLTENPAILTYLARTYPGAGLLPGADAEFAALETMSWFAAGIHPLVSRLRFPVGACDDPASFQCIRASARDALVESFDILEGRLSDRDWLFGEWSIIDVYMLWLWFRATGSGFDGSRFPRCTEHARRCEQRPTVSRVLDREEQVFTQLTSAGHFDLPPPYQVGRAPANVMPAPTSRQEL